MGQLKEEWESAWGITTATGGWISSSRTSRTRLSACITTTATAHSTMQYSRPDSRLAPKVWAGGLVWLTLTMTGGETYLSRLGTCTPRFRFEDCTSPTRNPRSCSETWVMGISKMSRQKPALGSHWLT